MNETWPSRPGREIWSLLDKITGSKSNEVSLIRKRRCSGMNETWPSRPGREIWSLHRRGDEARLHFCSAKIIVRLRRAVAANLPPAGWISSFEPVTHGTKKKSRCVSICFSFYGAGDEARTRYLHLGKVALYRMSYTRGTRDIIAIFLEMSICNSNILQILL